MIVKRYGYVVLYHKKGLTFQTNLGFLEQKTLSYQDLEELKFYLKTLLKIDYAVLI